ncbi:MAG: type IV pilin protein [Gammaproteobacteria bacterium]
MNTLTKTQSGVTLLELLIVLVIVGILASVAVPGYRAHALDTGRAAAAADLHELSLFLERAFSAQGRYDNAGNPGNLANPLPFTSSPRDDASVRYNVVLQGLNATSYTLRAVPVGGQAEDTDCGELRLDEAGTQCILAGASCSDSANASVREAVAACW